MRIVSTILFGSQARNDQSESSDTDLLMISLEHDRKHISTGTLSLFLYPWESLVEDAENGDLFTCHLAHEAKPLIDPDDYLTQLRERFRFRADYDQEMEKAVDFAWFLILMGDQINERLLAKRALWCVRTVLIAEAANQREAVFAPKLLAERSASKAGRRILESRHKLVEAERVRELLRAFLGDIGRGVGPTGVATQSDFIRLFSDTDNKVALQTLNQEAESKSGYN